MPPAKKTVRRAPARRSVVTSTAIATQTMTSTKLALATLFLGFSAMAAAAMGTSTPATSTPSGSTAGWTEPVPTTTLAIVPATDYSSVTRIITPTTSAQLGKWNLSTNGTVSIRKLRFNAINGNYTERKGAGEFGQMTLRDGDYGPVLAMASFVSSLGYVDFNIPAGYIVSPGQQKSLSLHAQIMGSGIMKENSMIRFGVTIGSANEWDVITSSAYKLPSWQLSFGSIKYGIGAPSPLHLYHNTVPQADSYFSNWTINNKLSLSKQSPIFPLTLYNLGDREYRVSKIMVKITTVGLAGSTSTPGGVLKGFKLWEVSSSGDLATLIAESPTACVVGQVPGGPAIGVKKMLDGTSCGINQTFVTFDNTVDVNGLMDNLTGPLPGMIGVWNSERRRFMVTADTTGISVGKTKDTISITGQISGNRGQFPSSDPKIPFWGSGGLSFHYTPVAGKENTTAYNQSDSYPINGPISTYAL